MDYHSGQRLPAIEDTDEYQRAFAGRRIAPDERRTKRGVVDDDTAHAEALALLERDFRTQPGYVEPIGPQGLLPGER